MAGARSAPRGLIFEWPLPGFITVGEVILVRGNLVMPVTAACGLLI